MTNKINMESPTANMFGVEPCPRCKSEYRVPTWLNPETKDTEIIKCDDCGLIEVQEK